MSKYIEAGITPNKKEFLGGHKIEIGKTYEVVQTETGFNIDYARNENPLNFKVVDDGSISQKPDGVTVPRHLIPTYLETTFGIKLDDRALRELGLGAVEKTKSSKHASVYENKAKRPPIKDTSNGSLISRMQKNMLGV